MNLMKDLIQNYKISLFVKYTNYYLRTQFFTQNKRRPRILS